MNESNKIQRAHALTGYIALGFSLLGGAVVWGRTSSELETARVAISAQATQLAAAQINIAVYGQKLDDIIQRLQRMEDKQDANNDTAVKTAKSKH